MDLKAPEGEFVRVTIDVPEDTLNALDQMKDFAGYASRGRTVQALVDAVKEMGDDSNRMKDLVAAYRQNLPNLQKTTQAEQLTSVLVYLTQYDSWVGNIVRRLSRFVKIL